MPACVPIVKALRELLLVISRVKPLALPSILKRFFINRFVVVAELKAVEEASKVPVGPTVRLPTTVEEALEMKPEFWVSRSRTYKVLDTDEEAVATKPPVASILKSVLEALF